MNRWAKAGLVFGGYVLAVVAGAVAGWLYDRRMAAMPYDTSGGMYAGGEALTSLAAFLVVAIAPTLLGLWFVRGHRTLWQWVAALSLGFAIAGLIAMLTTPLIAHDRARHPALLVIDLLWVAQLLGVPFWTVGFVLFAFLAPTRPARRLLVAAVGIELVIGVCAAIHWFLPGSRI
jgi:hypothetical protein